MLSESFLGHEILVLAQLRLELLGTRCSEVLQEGEDLCILLSKLLNCGKLLKLSEVDHINCLDREDNASASIFFNISLACKSILSLVKFEAGVHDLEGMTRLTKCVKNSSNFLVERSPLLLREVPRGGLFDNLACLVNNNVTAVLFEAENDQLFEGESFHSRVVVDGVVELHECIDLDLQRVLRVNEKVDELSSERLSLFVV